jgi:site-specific recombinase XerD
MATLQDDKHVLRGMVYGTGKSYGQHLRHYFDWLKEKQIAPEQATREDIRRYLVEMAWRAQAQGVLQ